MLFLDLKKEKYSALSEIQEHLPVLEKFAQECEQVVEFGVREGNSTVAFISGVKKKLISYDIFHTPIIDKLKLTKLPCEWEFRLQSTSDPNHVIEQTDMLFVDTDHTYEQVKAELTIHGNKVNKYIAFHDTFKYGLKSYCGEGINKAIYEFILASPSKWGVAYITDASNGLLILKNLTYLDNKISE